MNQLSKSLKVEYNVDYTLDSEFSAYARYLQSKWRVSKGYPIDEKKKYEILLTLILLKKLKPTF